MIKDITMLNKHFKEIFSCNLTNLCYNNSDKTPRTSATQVSQREIFLFLETFKCVMKLEKYGNALNGAKS